MILPKYRRKVLYERIRQDVGQILRDLCRQKDIELVEGKATPDHIHMLLSVPPRYSTAMTNERRFMSSLQNSPSDWIGRGLMNVGLRGF